MGRNSFEELKKVVKIPEQFAFNVRRNLQMIDDGSLTLDECLHSMYVIGMHEYAEKVGVNANGMMISPKTPEQKHIMETVNVLTKNSQTMFMIWFEKNARVALQNYYALMNRTLEGIKRESIDRELIKRLDLLGKPDVLGGFLDMINKAVEISECLKKEIVLEKLKSDEEKIVSAMKKEMPEIEVDRVYGQVREFFEAFYESESREKGREYLGQDNLLVEDEHILFVLNELNTDERFRFGKAQPHM